MLTGQGTDRIPTQEAPMLQLTAARRRALALLGALAVALPLPLLEASHASAATTVAHVAKKKTSSKKKVKTRQS